MPPGEPQLGKAVKQQHRLSVALFGDVELDIPDLHLPVTDARGHGGQQ
jgi:hypothetical protein